MKNTCTIALLLLFHFVHGQKSNETSYQKQISLSKDSIRSLMRTRQIPGLSITVSIDGKTIYSEGFGYADVEQGVKVDPAKTKFRIGSISKALTAAMLAKLYEQNKVVLDSSIYYYLPDYPKYKYRPTIRQVAGHIAGIRHYKGREFFISERYPSVTKSLDVFKNDSLLHAPGSKYYYTTHGFDLLSAVIEKAAKEDFLPLMKREIFQQLKMDNTTADMNDSIIHGRTRFYMLQKDKWINAPYVDNSYKWAGGGFISSSEDIARFANALLSNSLLRGQTLTLFTTAQKLNDGSFTTYGMGFATRKDDKGIAFFGHSGGSVGGTCDMVIYPDKKIVVVVLTNISNARLGSIANHIAQIYRK
jgi:CubicO group peptidase (beta-lactamase class C family)